VQPNFWGIFNIGMGLAYWIQICWNFWDISIRSRVISKYVFVFFNSAHNSARFFLDKKCFLDIKKS
jgi:hypothetical protein